MKIKIENPFSLFGFLVLFLLSLFLLNYTILTILAFDIGKEQRNELSRVYEWLINLDNPPGLETKEQSIDNLEEILSDFPPFIQSYIREADKVLDKVISNFDPAKNFVRKGDTTDLIKPAFEIDPEKGFISTIKKIQDDKSQANLLVNDAFGLFGVYNSKQIGCEFKTPEIDNAETKRLFGLFVREFKELYEINVDSIENNKQELIPRALAKAFGIKNETNLEYEILIPWVYMTDSLGMAQVTFPGSTLHADSLFKTDERPWFIQANGTHKKEYRLLTDPYVDFGYRNPRTSETQKNTIRYPLIRTYIRKINYGNKKIPDLKTNTPYFLAIDFMYIPKLDVEKKIFEESSDDFSHLNLFQLFDKERQNDALFFKIKNVENYLFYFLGLLLLFLLINYRFLKDYSYNLVKKEDFKKNGKNSSSPKKPLTLKGVEKFDLIKRDLYELSFWGVKLQIRLNKKIYKKIRKLNVTDKISDEIEFYSPELKETNIDNDLLRQNIEFALVLGHEGEFFSNKVFNPFSHENLKNLSLEKIGRLEEKRKELIATFEGSYRFSNGYQLLFEEYRHKEINAVIQDFYLAELFAHDKEDLLEQGYITNRIILFKNEEFWHKLIKEHPIKIKNLSVNDARNNDFGVRVCNLNKLGLDEADIKDQDFALLISGIKVSGVFITESYISEKSIRKGSYLSQFESNDSQEFPEGYSINIQGTYSSKLSDIKYYTELYELLKKKSVALRDYLEDLLR